MSSEQFQAAHASIYNTGTRLLKYLQEIRQGSPQLKPLPYPQAKRRLEAAGFGEVSQKGSLPNLPMKEPVLRSRLIIEKLLLVRWAVFYDKLG